MSSISELNKNKAKIGAKEERSTILAQHADRRSSKINEKTLEHKIANTKIKTHLEKIYKVRKSKDLPIKQMMSVLLVIPIRASQLPAVLPVDWRWGFQNEAPNKTRLSKTGQKLYKFFVSAHNNQIQPKMYE